MQQNQWFSLTKAIRQPMIVTPDTPVVEVIDLMSQGWVGNCQLDNYDSASDENLVIQENTSDCVLIADDGQLVGIFTERDVVELIAAGRNLQRITIAEVMSRKLVTIKIDDTSKDVFAARNLMRQHSIRHLPVMDECDQLLGVISSEGLRQLLRPTQWLRFCRVDEVMTTQVVHASSTTSVLDVIKLMIHHHVSCVVIVRGAGQNEESSDPGSCTLLPVGIITERDILQFQRLELNLESTQAQVVMSAPLFLVSPEDSLWAVNFLMQQRRVRRLVVAGSQQELVGIITQTSLLQALDPTEMYGVLELLERKVEELEAERKQLSQSYSTQTQLYQQTQKALEERQQAEKALRQEKNLISAILDVAAALIVVLDKQGNIIHFNQTCETITGYSFAEIKSKQVWDFIPPEEIETTREVFEELKRGEFPNQNENHWLAKNGDRHLISWSNTCSTDDNGSVKHIIATGIDITEKKQLELQFLRTQRLESIGTLAGGIAHDLNNILTPILAIAQLLPLKLPKADNQTQYLFEMLQNSAIRGANLVKQVLSFARGVEGERTTLQIKHIISEIREFVCNTFPKSIEIEVSIAKDLRPIYADGTQLHQVFMNLCVNARDAMPNGGTLTIGAKNIELDQNHAAISANSNLGDHVVVTVSDTGIGIPPKTLERIFEPFFTTKEQGKGTGLGLSTALGIIKSHGGFINVYSEVGKGTRFTVYLPAAHTVETTQNRQEEAPIGRGELILVVDDEEIIRQISKKSLEEYNYQVLTASNGIEAIALYAQHKDDISVVVMDMMMPSMDGLTAIYTLQQINPQVKVIAVSGLPSSEKIAIATQAGVKAFLAKPYASQELLRKLHLVINNS
ncbi:MAG: CBS domain-containing protein [Mastigocoleus sp. MO_167.B18]|nr:CBS domain-containing protein [Mastigocoleus sp. MO_167.B18]